VIIIDTRPGTAAYLALALDRGLTLATLDDPLRKAARKAGVAVAPVL